MLVFRRLLALGVMKIQDSRKRSFLYVENIPRNWWDLLRWNVLFGRQGEPADKQTV